MPIRSGTYLGPYEIVSAMGAGGMGEVYRARDPKLGRDVAIKVLPEAFTQDAERIARFQREAKVLASLSHPNIATMYGLEDSGATRALVMEPVEGPTLADRIKAGPIPCFERGMPMSAQAHPVELPPTAAILQMIQGFWVSRAIYVAAKLGIPDLLKDGPKSAENLAQVTSTHAPTLYRVMRALDSVGVLAEDGDGRFTLTPLGATLRTDVPGSLRFFVIEELGENHYPAWEKVLYSVRTGAIAFNHVYGASKWQYMQGHPEEARIFDEAMASVSSVFAAAIVGAYDFSSSKTVVDVGGGNGSLLTAILSVNPHLRGVLFDVPHVVAAARRGMEANLLERCEIVGGDFFKSVPAGDTCLLRWIIHDWDDEPSVAVLKNCRDAITAGGKVLIVEAVLQPGRATSFSKFLDLNMLVMTGGRERTETEYRKLLSTAGLSLARIIPTQTQVSIIEACAREG